MNNRKNKIIPSYELEIRLSWTGKVGEGEAKGTVVLPYVSDENADEEPEVSLCCFLRGRAHLGMGKGISTLVSPCSLFADEQAVNSKQMVERKAGVVSAWC